MRFRSLGAFIDAAAVHDDVTVISAPDRDADVGALTELGAERSGPLLLFDRFAGFDPDFRVASNIINSLRRYALLHAIPPDTHPVEIVNIQRKKMRSLQPIAPVEVTDGPVLTHTMLGDEVDIERFPAPRWHSSDGGRYIGTGDIVVVRDPITGDVNYGTYRVCVQGRDRASIWIIGHKAGRIIAEKYWKAGKPCPIAV